LKIKKHKPFDFNFLLGRERLAGKYASANKLDEEILYSNSTPAGLFQNIV
jgi:hypothetical protein